VQANATDVWFNIMFPGAYAPFLEILTQTWASITRQAWIVNYVIGNQHRHDWDGNIAAALSPSAAAYTTYGWTGASPAYTAWLDFEIGPGLSPLDSPSFLFYGDGPFNLQTIDLTNNYWSATRNVNYWRGWPASFPRLAGVSPAGYVNNIEVTWNFVWGTRETMFLHGDCDLCALGSASQIPQLYTTQTGGLGYPFNTKSTNYPQPGIQFMYPLPRLLVDSMFFTFNIGAATPLQTLCPTGTYDANKIPGDFFGMNENATAKAWSQHIRQAFAYAFDYTTYISTVDAGLAFKPATAIVPGLTYYNPAQPGYTYSLSTATNLLQNDPIWQTGFTLNMYYNTGNTARQEGCLLEQAAIQSLNPKFKINVIGLPWATILTAIKQQECPMFYIGWLVDYPDPHDFAFPFYDHAGAYGSWQALPLDWPMDADIVAGIQTPDGPARQAIYNKIQADAITLCPSFAVDQPYGSHMQQDWVQGWYYNSCYPDAYFYNLWKMYYSPQAQGSTTPVGALSEDNTADVNYDGKIDMKDIAVAAASFGATYGPPVPSNWVYRADVNNDRKIDMKDIAYCASYFGQASLKWSTNLVVSVAPSAVGLPDATHSTTLTATTAFGSGTLTYNWYMNGGGTAVATHTTSSITDPYTFTPSILGTYNFTCTVTNSTSYTATSNVAFVYVGPQTSISALTNYFNTTTNASLKFSSVSNGGTPPYTYTWYFSTNDVTFNNVTNVDGGAASYTLTSALVTGPGTYYLYLVVKDSALLTGQSTTQVITAGP